MTVRKDDRSFGDKINHRLTDEISRHFRPLAIFFIVLPLSFLYRHFKVTWEWLFPPVTTLEEHVKKTQRVAREVSECPADKIVCSARPPWKNLSTRVVSYKDSAHRVTTWDLTNVVELKEDELLVRVQPLIETGTLTRWLIKRGYMLATTLEIEEATVGGLALAVGMTTASHKYGLLGTETVVEWEVVDASGNLLTVRADNEHADLFRCLPWSHGSLGILVGLTLKIVKVTPTVAVTYEPFTWRYTYMERYRELSLADDPPDFIEVTCFSKNDAVITHASFCEMPKSKKVTAIEHWQFPWFYTHIRDKLKSTEKVVEYVDTYSYIFRHNRAIFWTFKEQFPEAIGNHPLFRNIFGWMLPPVVQFLKLPATATLDHELMSHKVYQDIVLPISEAERSMDLAAEKFNIWPILMYPCKVYCNRRGIFPEPRPQDIIDNGREEPFAMYMDLGVYGTPELVHRQQPTPTVKHLRDFEEYTSSVQGAPFLYAHTFMTKEEFTQMFNLTLYDEVRKKYNCDGTYLHVWEKTKLPLDPDVLLDRERELIENGRFYSILEPWEAPDKKWVGAKKVQ